MSENKNMENIFYKDKIYSENEINKIADMNSLVMVDCLKDENMISVEELIDGDLGGECLFEFNKVGEDKFLLRWSEL